MNSLKLNFNIDFSKHSIYNEKNAKINGLVNALRLKYKEETTFHYTTLVLVLILDKQEAFHYLCGFQMFFLMFITIDFSNLGHHIIKKITVVIRI